MDPRNPGSQHNLLPAPNNPQPGFIQAPVNRFGANGQIAYMQQALRRPNFQSPPRMARNVATVGPMTGKMSQMENVGEFQEESVLPIPNQPEVSSINMQGDPLSGNYQRGSPLFSHQGTPSMVSTSNIRGVQPLQQTLFNQMSMDAVHQQRFQPPCNPRFFGVSPSNQHAADGNIMGAMSTPEVGAMSQMCHSSTYDGSFGVKPIPGGPSVLRQFPPQHFTSGQPPQMPISSQNMQPPHLQYAPSTPMRVLEMSDPTRQATRQPPLESQPQQTSVQQQVAPVTPFPPPGPSTQFPVPAKGTCCSLCSRDLSRPPPTLRSPLSFQDPPVQCEAGCREWYHLTCSGLSPEAFYLLKSEGPLVEWLCNACSKRAHPNIPYVRLRY